MSLFTMIFKDLTIDFVLHFFCFNVCLVSFLIYGRLGEMKTEVEESHATSFRNGVSCHFPGCWQSLSD